MSYLADIALDAARAQGIVITLMPGRKDIRVKGTMNAELRRTLRATKADVTVRLRLEEGMEILCAMERRGDTETPEYAAGKRAFDVLLDRYRASYGTEART